MNSMGNIHAQITCASASTLAANDLRVNSSVAEQTLDKGQVAGSFPASRTMATGVTDKFTGGASTVRRGSSVVERLPEEEGVTGAIPVRGTIPFGPLWRRSSLIPSGSSMRCRANSKSASRGCDSLRPRQFPQQRTQRA